MQQTAHVACLFKCIHSYTVSHTVFAHIYFCSCCFGSRTHTHTADDNELLNCIDFHAIIIIILPRPFPLLCGVDVSYKTPQFNWVLPFLTLQYSLRQFVPDVIEPPPFLSSSLIFTGTSITITLLPTYSSSLLNTCPYHFNQLSCTLLDIFHTFDVALILSFLPFQSRTVTDIQPVYAIN